MKKLISILLGLMLLLGLSLNLYSQSDQKDLDQVELMKQFIGIWKYEFVGDSVNLFTVTPYGKGYELSGDHKAKGESYTTWKGIAGFTGDNQKLNWYSIYPAYGNPIRDLGEFVTSDKLVMDRHNFDYSRIFTKWEGIFLTPDKIKFIMKRRGEDGTWDNPVVNEYIWVRVKE